MDFDYIIVGAGSAGCVVANRLSASGRNSVLLLEAGPSDRSPWIKFPVGYSRSYNNPAVNWRYWSEPVPTLGNRKIYYPRGKVVGGSSAINALVYNRGAPEDYDSWAAEGNPGWSAADLWPIFERMEALDGTIPAADISAHAHDLCKSFFAAGHELGFSFMDELKSAEREGLGYFRMTLRNSARVSSAHAHLGPARGRRNLRIETGAVARRILFTGKRAAGVSYEQKGAIQQAGARREVIVSAGAIGSPHLLMLSGIGNENELRRVGIAIVDANPSVGKHLHDHSAFDFYFESRVPSLNSELASLAGQAFAGLKYVLARSGPLSIGLNQAGGFVRTVGALTRPNMQLYFCPLAFEKPAENARQIMKVSPEPAFSLGASPSHPKSRGALILRSADATVAPEIHPNLLADEDDRQVAVAAARLIRRFAASPALAEVIARETKPGPHAASDEQIFDYIKETAYSIFHPCGTCRMGPDPKNSVVDARLRVHGLAGLRIIDASVFPSVPSANTNAPAIMVGEKGAELVKAES
jgi:choline dehydrogenase